MVAQRDKAVEFLKYISQNRPDGVQELIECWVHGQWDVIRKEWPEVPQSVFVEYYPEG